MQLGASTALVRIYPFSELATGAPGRGEPGHISSNEAADRSSALWYAELTVHTGQVTSCTIFEPTGKPWREGEQAIIFLRHIGRLEYEILHPSSPEGPARGPVAPVEFFPSLAANLAPGTGSPEHRLPGPAPYGQSTGYDLNWCPARTPWGETYARRSGSLPREQFRILLLINGQRPVVELASLLGYQPADLYRRLLALKQQGLIT